MKLILPSLRLAPESGLRSMNGVNETIIVDLSPMPTPDLMGSNAHAMGKPFSELSPERRDAVRKSLLSDVGK
jgi:hypothetical protein